MNWCRLLAVVAVVWLTKAALAESPRLRYTVTDLSFRDLSRTDEAWLRSYLGQEVPTLLTQEDAEFLKRRLLTLDVFSSVSYFFEPAPGVPDGYHLVFVVAEKWTTIPVIRGAFGGGTPLRVFGLYDIHTLGRRLVVGGESRQYGDAPIGYVLYARSPYSARGRLQLGAEFWRDRRQRVIYDGRERIEQGNLETDITRVRTTLLGRIGWLRAGSKPLSLGIDLTILRHERPLRYERGERSTLKDLPMALPDAKETTSFILPAAIYDDVEIDQLQMDGLRLIAKVGGAIAGSERYSRFEVEPFYFRRFGSWNLALHLHALSSGSREFDAVTFLGGFDSVRGIPDGALYGSKAAYTNVEIRKIFARYRYTWLEAAAFYDAGAAGFEWDELPDQAASALGMGLRVAIPQVHRLMFRIDYAWSVDGSGTQSLSAGLNQFFQPYRPL